MNPPPLRPDVDAASDPWIAEALAAAPPEDLRARIFASTTAPLRRRRVVRRIAVLGASIAVFALGRATAPAAATADEVRAALRDTGPSVGRPTSRDDAGQDRSAPAAAVTPAPPSAAVDPALLAGADDAVSDELRAASPERLESLALRLDGDARAELLKAAGDRFLSARVDVDAALRCYRGYLRIVGAAQQRRDRAGDTWLLSALKSSTL